ncbi:protein with a bacterial immunoglobulin-like domain protein [Legionella birminghamensis]|uniref:Protein with a bacterial immunoglobulin-like domain n=1 Tax=Legionella birminghamensis TaxID=28083 RepID=A0A378I6S7_9GAMM|nr:hypothetical protein [Legionella birminghamensis]KTC68376.1 protein with a bacterial immunoglobulin-like domain protein [Legionella birminghamensis]STX30908.1 protein with a bacterial immunoglobulin-like domain [Legionella birminghamensis]
MKLFLFKRLVALFSLLIMFANSYALPIPKFSVDVIQRAPLEIANNNTGVAIYKVTNNTAVPRILTTKPIKGIRQITGGNGVCPSPFLLSRGEFCFLYLQIDGNSIDPVVKGGPIVCKTNGPGDNSPDQFLCSQPSVQDSLNVTRIEAKNTPCSTDAQCQTNFCDPMTHTCRSCRSSSDCAPGSTCNSSGICVAPAGIPCSLNTDCQSNFCNPQTHICSACTASSQCAVGSTCNNSGVCVATNGAACSGTQSCIAGSICQSGQCAGPNGAVCQTNANCQSGACVLGRCQGLTNGSPCITNGNCQSNFCLAAVCTAPNNGAACTTSVQCQSGYCSPSTQTCAQPNTGAPCTNNSSCQSNQCVAGVCNAPVQICLSSTDCPNGENCISGSCVAMCIPQTCAQIGANCGTNNDGCGGTIFCGNCVLPETCGGGGPSQCGTNPCVPQTCAQQGASCGIVADGCGGIISCGACAPGQVCVANTCQ